MDGRSFFFKTVIVFMFGYRPVFEDNVYIHCVSILFYRHFEILIVYPCLACFVLPFCHAIILLYIWLNFEFAYF